ncbi:hypothetical protein ScPMuIL_009828 [Solemya velum]
MDKKQSSDLLGVTGKNFSIETAKKLVVNGKKDFGTFKPPPSSIVGKVRDFLPQIDKANKDLEKKVQSGLAADINIENTDNCEGPVIVMNLALFDHNSCTADDCSSESSSSSDSDSEEEKYGETTETESVLKISPQTNLRKNLVEFKMDFELNEWGVDNDASSLNTSLFGKSPTGKKKLRVKGVESTVKYADSSKTVGAGKRSAVKFHSDSKIHSKKQRHGNQGKRLNFSQKSPTDVEKFHEDSENDELDLSKLSKKRKKHMKEKTRKMKKKSCLREVRRKLSMMNSSLMRI